MEDTRSELKKSLENIYSKALKGEARESATTMLIGVRKSLREAVAIEDYEDAQVYQDFLNNIEAKTAVKELLVSVNITQ